MRPNFFDYADNERTQDAVICWLIEWSAVQAENADEQALRNLGGVFVQSLFVMHGVNLQGQIQNAGIYQQYNRIDVLARIRDESTEHVLLIEDKTAPAPNVYTAGETLEKLCCRLQGYSECVRNGETQLGPVCKHLPIYLTTANQSLAKDRTIEEAGFRVFRRSGFLEVLNNYQDPHPIVTDFRNRLQQLEDDFKSYRRWRNEDDRATWSWAGWEGFYRHLEEKLSDRLEGECKSKDEWGHVNNPRGGFLGFWRHLPESNFYLQLEVYPEDPGRQNLCFKVYRDNRQRRAEEFYDCLVKTAIDLGLEELIKRPNFGAGYNITFGWFNQWLVYNDNGTLDCNRIVEHWQQAWRIIGEVNMRFVNNIC